MHGGHDQDVTSAVFSAGGARVLIASDDMTARMRGANTGAHQLAFEGHDRYVTSAVFSADGARVLTASNDMTTMIWDAAPAPPGHARGARPVRELRGLFGRRRPRAHRIR